MYSCQRRLSRWKLLNPDHWCNYSSPRPTGISSSVCRTRGQRQVHSDERGATCAEKRSDSVTWQSITRSWRGEGQRWGGLCVHAFQRGWDELQEAGGGSVAIVSDGWLTANTAETAQGQSTGTFPLIPASLAAAVPESDCRLAPTFSDGFILLERTSEFWPASDLGKYWLSSLVFVLVIMCSMI